MSRGRTDAAGASEELRILIAGGGTGGHVVPGLAIAGELKRRFGATVRFVGTARGLETRLVPEAGYELELIRVGMLKNVSLLTRARTLGDLPLGVRRCIRLIREFRPHVAVGVGGYASGPAMMAAVLLRVPTLAYEPNVVPGLANRIVGRAVSAAAVNFERSRRYFRNAMVTGVPVRKEFFEVPPLNEEAPGLLVTGGSQGARVFNEVLPRIARALFQQVPGLTLVHQTGARRGGEVRGRYMDEDIDPLRWKAEEFLGDMPRRMSAASLVLCRSGATTVAELAAAGRPALLIPFPKSADDHQRKNAEAFANAGAGRVLLESELTPDRLLKELVGMLGNRELLSGMGTRARTLGRPDALERIGTMVAQLAGR